LHDKNHKTQFQIGSTLNERCFHRLPPYDTQGSLPQTQHKDSEMGRGGAQPASSPSPVPVLRALRGPGGGFNHKQLNATTTAPFKPMERSLSPVKDIGSRNRRGRANVGVSNRRTTAMPVEVSSDPPPAARDLLHLLAARGAIANAQPGHCWCLSCAALLRCADFAFRPLHRASGSELHRQGGAE